MPARARAARRAGATRMDNTDSQSAEARELEYQLTPSDIIRATIGWVYTDHAQRQLSARVAEEKRNALFVAVGILFATYGLLSLLYDLIESGQREINVLFGFGLVSLMLGVAAYAFTAPRSRFWDRVATETAKRQLRHVGPGHSGEGRVSIDREAFVIESQVDRNAYAWSAVRDVVCFDGFTALVLFDGRAHVVPDSAFESEIDREQFVQVCRDRIEAAGGLDTMTARFLSDRDFNCLQCGYQLRGIGGASCPECGRAVEPSDFSKLVAPGLISRVVHLHRY